MREIKFRVWNIYLKKYFGPVSLFKNEEHNRPITCNFTNHESDIFGQVLHPEGCVLEQFTGLLDKNGVEIYDGDIVSTWHEVVVGIDHNEAEICETEKYESVVIYEKDGFGVVVDGMGLISLSYWEDNIEIIGNIHQNKDLLKC